MWMGEGRRPIEVMFRGLDKPDDVQRVLSWDLAAAWIDEPQGGIAIKRDGAVVVEPGIAHDLFKAILGRCGRQRGYRKMCWLTGNPPSPSRRALRTTANCLRKTRREPTVVS